MADDKTEKGRVLIIDDSVEVLEMGRGSLESHGYTVFTSTTVFCADLIAAEAPDLLLLDICMPGLPGDKAARGFLASGMFRDVAVLLHSTLPEVDVERKVRETGADGYIPKAMSIHDFRDAVDDWMERRRSGGIPRLEAHRSGS